MAAQRKSGKESDKFARWFKAKRSGGSRGRKGKAKNASAGRLPHEGDKVSPSKSELLPKAKGNKRKAANLLEPAEGVSDGLRQKLLATKQRLLAGNAEAARAGVVQAETAESTGRLRGHGGTASKFGAQAEPGAWAAMQAEKEKANDGKNEQKGRLGFPGSADTTGSVRLKAKSKGKGKEPGKGKGSKKGKGQGQASKKVPVVREELVRLNREIASHAQLRDLPAVHATLRNLEEKGWANGHTYAAAVHALCRCGDWQSAEAALGRAEEAGLFRRGAGAASGLITRTSMLRGYVECARDLGKARSLLERMEKEKCLAGRPNVRTANTFLRGCLVLGSVADAEAVLHRMQTVWAAQDDWRDQHGGRPDASTYEILVTLLCQALKHGRARKLAAEAVETLGVSPGCAAMFVAAARAALISGDTAAAAAAVKRARKTLAREGEFSEKKLSNFAGSGGKRGTKKWASDGAESDARARSLEVFQDHRQREILADLKEIEALLPGSEPGAKVPAIDLPKLFMRTLCFEDYGDSQTAASESLAQALHRRLCEKLGLENGTDAAETVRQKFRTLTGKGSKKRKATEGTEATVPRARIDLRGLFAEPGEEFTQTLHLELCSGSGEWLCSQALRDTSVNWVASELRFDRAARCFQRFALRGLAAEGANAGLLVGDAKGTLEAHLVPGCVARLFINHPEPPHQTDLERAAQSGEAREAGSGTESTHLLTLAFLRDACAAVLAPEGTLTVCTDNLAYGQWLLKAFASEGLRELFKDALKGKGFKEGLVAEEKGFKLRSQPPPCEVAGALYKGSDGGSYFQRLKDNFVATVEVVEHVLGLVRQSEKGSRGQENDRYYLCLRKRAGIIKAEQKFGHSPPGKDTVETSKEARLRSGFKACEELLEVADDWSALTDEHPADATSSFLPASVAEWLLELRGRRPGDTLLFPEPLNLGDRVFTSASVERDFRTASGALLLRMDPGGHRYIVKFADVRQEHAMMCALMEMNRRWKEHQVSVCGRSVQTVTYEIYPIGSSGGLIEAVDGCRTLRELKRLCHPETHQRVYRALAGDASKLDTLAATTVAYLTACYALGVRDGHDDNIMLREDGSLFRVDFGFVFGATPEIDTPQTVVAFHSEEKGCYANCKSELSLQVVGACGDSLTALTGDSYGSPPALECLSSVPETCFATAAIVLIFDLEMEPFLPLARLHTASLSLAGFCQDVSCADQWSFSRAAKNTLREAVQFLRDQAGLGPEAPTSQANNSKVLGDLAVWMAPGAEDAEPDLEAHLNFVLDSGVDLLGLYRAAPERFTADGKPLNLQDFGDLFLGPLADFAEVAREGLVIEDCIASFWV
ncbi:age-1 [Symbiodinium sp. KB8]|nr:age-1 [Symbiodinium sp. KB8]